MKTIFIGTLLTFLLGAHIYANLGDTIPEAEQRYGKPTETKAATSGDGVALGEGCIENKYLFSGMLIRVNFVHGRSLAESFGKEDGSDFSPDDLERLLKANSLGRSWIMAEDKYHFKDGHWTLDDKSASAMVTNQKLKLGPQEFYVVSNAFRDVASKRTEANRQNSLMPVKAW